MEFDDNGGGVYADDSGLVDCSIDGNMLYGHQSKSQGQLPKGRNHKFEGQIFGGEGDITTEEIMNDKDQYTSETTKSRKSKMLI